MNKSKRTKILTGPLPGGNSPEETRRMNAEQPPARPEETDPLLITRFGPWDGKWEAKAENVPPRRPLSFYEQRAKERSITDLAKPVEILPNDGPRGDEMTS